MSTVIQPTALPTNKLTASIAGMVLGAVAYSFAVQMFPFLSTVEVAGVGDLDLIFQLLGASVLGWFVPDRPNVKTD